MRTSSGAWNWTVIVPVALVLLAVAAIIALDATKGGAAEPAAPLGEIGTPVRQAYIAPTATPVGQQVGATPRPRPTFAGVAAAQGDPAARDTTRRNDLLRLIAAAQDLKKRDGSYPTTKGNVQTVCAYKDIDIGCKLKETFDGNLPSDPLGDPVKNGYWYSSDGNSVTVYAALEGEIPADQQCDTNDAELKKRQHVICLRAS